ncbi:MAG: GTP cyclohydrolase FolE2 [Bermanella sp.]
MSLFILARHQDKELHMSEKRLTEMPDVASSQAPQINGTLNWVGMNRIALPVTVRDSDLGDSRVNAFVQTYVNLKNPEVKGIHMSRLYLLLSEFSDNKTLSASNLREFLAHMLDSHHDISDQASLNFEFDYVIKRKALKSQFSGWKDYPAQIKATLKDGKVALELGIDVTYSSTCPCSAALARQLIQEAFHSDFEGQEQISRDEVESWLRSEKGTLATPHSQRSTAKIWVKLNENMDDFPITEVIGVIEDALKTPVQTAVKREDEQEFARLNGQNLMFCEDAARRVKNALNKQENMFHDFWLRIEHLESLHAHDAVAIATKGLSNGYEPLLTR